MSKRLSEMTLEELWQLFPIYPVEHNADWKIWYCEQAEKLSALLPDAVINHVGSTAIDGIWAKDIVDILVEISGSMDAACNKLTANGWTLMSRSETRMSFNMGYTESGFAEKVYHLHLRFSGDRDEVYFRDYMNAHPEAAKEYEALKLELWGKYEHDRDGYTNAKTDFVRRYTRMAKIRFEYIENADFADYVEVLYGMLRDNMADIAPAESFEEWNNAVGDGMKKPARRIVLIKYGQAIIGYFQYYTNADTFMMEEIQLLPEYRREYGIFRRLYGYLLQYLPENLKYVKAYAHKANTKSDAILRHMGLRLTEDGEIRAYCGAYSDFVKWYENGRS